MAGNRAIVRRIEPMIGPAAAILLGFAAGFFCFAMPHTLIGRVVDPAMIGGRLPLALSVALIVGLATWALFCALDRLGGPRRGVLALTTRHAAPVLRRADAHPDAPPRRPIFAGSDLGTPLDLIDPLPVAYPETLAPTPVPEIPEAEVHHAPEPVVPAETMLPERPPLAPRSIARAVSAAPAIDAAIDTSTPLPAMMARLEAGLARKALVLAGAEANVTALRREIRPVAGSLRDAVAVLQSRTAARR